MKAKWNQPDLICDSHHGVYCPQFTVKDLATFVQRQIMTQDKWAYDTVLNGPNDESYWEAWDIITNMQLFTQTGQKFTIYQNEDVWLVPACFDRSKAAAEFYQSY